MPEININIDNRISLSEAAKVMGYHQDYIGQLCRAGKLKAIKLGRNWFTTHDAINQFKLTAYQPADSNIDDDGEESTVIVQQDKLLEPIPELSISTAPELSETIVVSKVTGLPIMLQTRPAALRTTNTVQSLLTALKIKSLQEEMASVRTVLEQLIIEVASQGDVLKSKPWLRSDATRSAYASNFDFNPAASHAPTMREQVTMTAAPAPVIWTQWIFSTALLIVLGLGVISIFNGSFLGDNSQGITIRYPSREKLEAVAGSMTNDAFESPSANSGMIIQSPQVNTSEIETDPNNVQTISGAPVGDLLQ